MDISGTTKKIGRLISNIVGFASLAFGFLFEDQLVEFSHQPVFVWAASVGLSGLLIAGVYFLFWKNKYYNSYLNGVERFWNEFWKIPIAGLGRAFVNLASALLPFYQHPIIFVPLALYF